MDEEIKVPSAENPDLSNQRTVFMPGVEQNIFFHGFSTARNSAYLNSAFPVHSTLFLSEFSSKSK